MVGKHHKCVFVGSGSASNHQNDENSKNFKFEFKLRMHQIFFNFLTLETFICRHWITRWTSIHSRFNLCILSLKFVNFLCENRHVLRWIDNWKFGYSRVLSCGFRVCLKIDAPNLKPSLMTTTSDVILTNARKVRGSKLLWNLIRLCISEADSVRCNLTF